MQAFRRTFAEEFGVDPISGDVSFSGRSDRAIAADLFAAHGIDPSLENWERFYGGYIARVDEELPRHEGTVLPGVEALLVGNNEYDVRLFHGPVATVTLSL